MGCVDQWNAVANLHMRCADASQQRLQQNISEGSTTNLQILGAIKPFKHH